MITSVEDYWTSELGETVEITESGGFDVRISGQACYTADTLDEIEKWLGVYSLVRGVW